MARGVRSRKAPRCLAAARALKNPERRLALLMVMTVCVLVDAALEDRLRTGRTDSQATCPRQNGQPRPHPTARWVVQSVGGIPRLRLPGEGAVGLQVPAQHRQLRRILEPPDEAFYA